MNRWLARLLVLLLAPVVLVASGSESWAEPVFGDAESVTIDHDYGSWQGNGYSCDIVGYWSTSPLQGPGSSGSASQVNVKGDCGTNWNVSDFSLSFEGKGSGCSVTYSTGQLDGDGSFSAAMAGDGSSCFITEMCYTATYDLHSDWETHSDEGCEPWALGAPPQITLPGACSTASVAVPVIGSPYWGLSNGTPGTGLQVRGWWQPVTYSATGITAGGEWIGYSIIRPYSNAWDGNYVGGGYSTVGIQAHSNTAAPSGGSVSFTDRAHVSSHNGQSDSPSGGVDGTIVGVGMFRVPSGGSGANWMNMPQYDGTPHARLGVNDPSQCAFYWGEKIAVTTTDDRDEPSGPLPGGGGSPTPPTDTPDADDPPPAEPEGSCDGFSLTDPASWGATAMCAAAALLGRLVRLVGDLVSVVKGMVAAILDGIAGLLIPSDGFFDEQWDELSDVYEDSSPSKYVDAVDQIAPSGGGGGCSGPTVTVPIHGNTETIQPLEACGGARASAASICRLILTVGISVFGALACIRAIGSGLGWNPGVGGGSA